MPRTRIITFFVAVAFLVPLAACGRSSEDAMLELRKLGVTYTADAFVECAKNGDIVAMKLFVEAGMKPDTPDKHGVTALMWTANSGHTEVVQALLDKGADVNVKNNSGVTTLRLAAIKDQTEIVKLLKQAGARK